MKPELLISSSALIHNVKYLQKKSALKLFPVLKADAYGHGAVLCSSVLENNFSDEDLPYFCVARLGEAKELREAGVTRPLLVLSQYSVEEILDEKVKDLSFAVNSVALANDFVRSSDRLFAYVDSLHLHFNTGMNRLGLPWAELAENKKVFSSLQAANYKVSGLMTHFACSEHDPDNFTALQIERFNSLCKDISDSSVKWIHASNSTATVRALAELENATRPGLYLWGLDHSRNDFKPQDFNLKPVLSARAPLLEIKRVSKGEAVGYGQSYRFKKDSLVASVALGYADGIDLSLSRSTEDVYDLGFLVADHKVPIVGKVSMDIALVDLSEHPKREQLSTAEYAYWICEKQGVGDVAKSLNKIPYEVLCSFGHRLSRRIV